MQNAVRLIDSINRNDAQGNAICNELHEMNPEGQAIFIQRDISTLKNVDELCKDLQQREPKINCLFLTAGYMTLRLDILVSDMLASR